jgi:hypothetical protein
MNYCTIQEAWGQGNYISNQLKNETNIEKKPIENFENSENNIIKKREPFKNSHKNNREDKFNCNNFFAHIKTCRQCQIKMRDEFRPKILENFEDIIQTNRDIIVLILVGLCFMIFFNMVSNIASNNKSSI